MEGKRPEARYASSACRTRDWKRRREAAARDARETSQNARPKRVEQRVSLRKAVRHAEATRSPGIAREVRDVLMEVLPDRQRAALGHLGSAAAAVAIRRG